MYVVCQENRWEHYWGGRIRLENLCTSREASNTE